MNLTVSCLAGRSAELELELELVLGGAALLVSSGAVAPAGAPCGWLQTVAGPQSSTGRHQSTVPRLSQVQPDTAVQWHHQSRILVSIDRINSCRESESQSPAGARESEFESELEIHRPQLWVTTAQSQNICNQKVTLKSPGVWIVSSSDAVVDASSINWLHDTCVRKIDVYF